MNNTKQIGLAVVASALALGAALGLSYRAEAQEPTGTPAPAEAAPADEMTRHGRGPSAAGLVVVREGRDAALAEALGVTVETLDAARESARAAVRAARAEGESESEGRAQRGGMAELREGYEAALAEALGITTEALDAAQETARATMVAQAVAEGRITQERADLVVARAAFREAVDARAIIAQALGMTAEAFDAALADGQRLPDLIEASGLTRAEFPAALTSAFEAAVDASVADGTLTQPQGDALKEEGMRVGQGMGRRGPRGGPHFHFHFHGERDAPSEAPDSGT